MPAIVTDILIVGSGVGATAAAKRLAESGKRVVLITGVGCSRSPHLDGGLVDPGLVASVFGPDAPLGEAVHESQKLVSISRDRFEVDSSTATSPRLRYRRGVLESWAMQRAVSAGAVYLDDFVESKALPNGDGSMTMTSERDDRTIRAGVIALCEGADPRIPLRVKLRPDYGPEDQLHFARTVLGGRASGILRHGSWRTSWGMPVGFQVNPQHDGAIVSVVARIENVMRCSRSSGDALMDLLASRAFASLGVGGERSDIGTELVALRRELRGARFLHDRLVMGIDASGIIDPRRADRADLTIRSGMHLARSLQETRSLEAWPEAAGEFVRGVIPPLAAYHDDRGTGFLEEGPGSTRGALAAKLGSLIRPGQ